MSNKINNFTNVRIQGVSHQKVLNHLKHNLRHVPTLSNTNDNHNIFINGLDGKQFSVQGSKNEDTKNMYQGFSKRYREDRKIHNECFKENSKRNLRNTQGSWAEGILTFSEQLEIDLNSGKISEEELFSAATSMLKELEIEWKTKIEFVAFHRDEKSKHFHFMFKNFNEFGKSITHDKRDKNSLSSLQDLMHKHFKHLGMDRGIKKTVSSFDHKKTRTDLTINKQIEIIKDNSSIIDRILLEQSELRKANSSIYIEINDLKAERKSVSEDVNLAKSAKKEIYGEISAKQKILREEHKIHNAKLKQLNEKVKEIKTLQKEVQEKIDNYDKAMNMLPEDVQKMISNYNDIIDRNELLEDFVENNDLTEDLNDFEDSRGQGMSEEALSLLDTKIDAVNSTQRKI